jgi:hypothetical protein
MKKVSLYISKPARGAIAEFDADHVRVNGGMRASVESKVKSNSVRLVRNKKGGKMKRLKLNTLCAFRGCRWFSSASVLRAAIRGGFGLSSQRNFIGTRLVRGKR